MSTRWLGAAFPRLITGLILATCLSSIGAATPISMRSAAAQALPRLQCVGGPRDGAPCHDTVADCPQGLCVDVSPPIACDTCAAVLVGTASGRPGDAVNVAVTFRQGPTDIVGLQNDLRFDPATAITRCKTNPNGDHRAGGFHLVAAALRAVVLGIEPSPFVDGALLYTCEMQIAPDAVPGAYALRISNVLGSDAVGRPIPTSGQNGVVVVDPSLPGSTPVATRTPTPTARPTPTTNPDTVVTLAVSSVTGNRGDRGQVSVTYSSSGSDPSDGVQNDLVFNAQTFIVPRADGMPDCAVAPALAFRDAVFRFLPNGCSPGIDCLGVRTAILQPAHLQAKGSLLYTCTLQIGATVPPGTYPLRIDAAFAAVGLTEFRVDLVNGDIAVTSAPGETPLPTWTATATATATPTSPASSAGVPDGLPAPGAGGAGAEVANGGGCALADGAHFRGATWLAGLCVLLVARRGRRRS